MRAHRWLAAVALGAAASLALAGTASAGTIHVHNDHDHGPGSLRQSITDSSAGDTIVVPRDTYVLRSGEIMIDHALAIRGAGASKTVIDARHDSRVFNVSPAADPVSVSKLTITGGREVFGGGILNSGNLKVKRVVFKDNVAAGDSFTGGGAIVDAGVLKVVASTFHDNHTSATAEGLGGAIENGDGPTDGTVITIMRSTFTRNSAPVDGFGGAVAWQTNDIDGGLTIINSTFAHNLAKGGVNFSGTGGALWFNPNEFADGHQVSLLLGSNTFSDNRAITQGTNSFGGAMYISPRPYDAGASNPTTLINNTITGNTAGTADGQGLGGGIFFDTFFAPGGDAPTDFINNTIAGNRALGDDGQGGGLYISTSSGEVPSVLNTIIANNRAAADKDCHGHPVSNGNNLERHESCDFSTAEDQQNTDPKLKQLANNGGPTKTMAIGKGSPAKNRGADIGCPSDDQRGVPRPQGLHCDVGAFELKIP
jgi:hypothetical protein